MNQHDVYFAGGSFWSLEQYMHLVHGVVDTEVGYANGRTLHPTFEEVCTGTTGYAQAVHVIYNAHSAPLEFLVKMYCKAVDPTSLNRQGMDIGSQYRCAIFYDRPEDHLVITQALADMAPLYDDPLVVECEPLKEFVVAEEVHQRYLQRNPHGYSRLLPSMYEYARNATVGSVLK